MTNADYHWLAGILEGRHGRLNMSNGTAHGPRIEIHTTSEALFDELVRLCGPARRTCRYRKSSQSTVYMFEISSARTFLIVRSLQKYFRLNTQDVTDILAWKPTYKAPIESAAELLRELGWKVSTRGIKYQRDAS
jgi:hypothetical protein